MLRALTLAGLLVSGCGPGQTFVGLEMEGPVTGTANEVFFRCEGDPVEEVRLSPDWRTTGAFSCSGLHIGAVCNQLGERPLPGSHRCDNPEFNPLLGTCVERFFAAFRPEGSCAQVGDRVVWDNGFYITADGGMYTPFGEEPIILIDSYVDIGVFAPESSLVRRYLQPVLVGGATR